MRTAACVRLCVCVCVCVDDPDCTYEWLYNSNDTACGNNSIQFNSTEVLDCTNKAYYRQALKEEQLTKSVRITNNKTTAARAHNTTHICPVRWPYRLHRMAFNFAMKNQYFIQAEIESRLKPGNVCYHSVQNLLSSSLLSKNINIKIYRTEILPDFSMGVKLGLSYWGRNVGWGWRIGCWGRYLGLSGTR